MGDENISLEDDEMQELAVLVAEALQNGESRDKVIADLAKNGMAPDEAEQFVSIVEYQLYQVDAHQSHGGGGGGEGMGWLIWIGIIIGINVLSRIFGWGFTFF